MKCISVNFKWEVTFQAMGGNEVKYRGDLGDGYTF